jgi:hypothetical protein
MAKQRRTSSTEYYSLPQALTWLVFGRADPTPDFAPLDVVNAAVRGDEAGIAEQAIAIRDEVQKRLETGRIVAYGVRDGSTQHRPIPQTDWRTIDTLKVFDANISPTAVGMSGDTTSRWFNVVVKVVDLRALRKRIPLSTGRRDEACAAIQKAYEDKGRQLTERDLVELRKTPQLHSLSRDHVRELAIAVQGPRHRGRPTQSKNSRK